MTDAAAAERHHSETKGRTLIETAYATLRNEIIDGTLEPGAKLRTEELRARYDVSGSTIREALTRLLGEALVTSEGQRGFRVAPATLEDFRDLTDVRKLIETEALRQAIAAGGEAWEGDIVAAFYRLSKAEERLRDDPAGASAEFEARNRDFHRALIAACPSPWLHRLHALLYQQSERYRRLVASRRAIPARRPRRAPGHSRRDAGARLRSRLQAGRRPYRAFGGRAADADRGEGEGGRPTTAVGVLLRCASRGANRVGGSGVTRPNPPLWFRCWSARPTGSIVGDGTRFSIRSPCASKSVRGWPDLASCARPDPRIAR